jgi:hypothetical protein
VKIALMQLYWWVPMRARTYARAPATVLEYVIGFGLAFGFGFAVGAAVGEGEGVGVALAGGVHDGAGVAGAAVQEGSWSSQLAWLIVPASATGTTAAIGPAWASENAGSTATAEPAKTRVATAAAIAVALGVSLKGLLGVRAWTAEGV